MVSGASHCHTVSLLRNILAQCSLKFGLWVLNKIGQQRFLCQEVFCICQGPLSIWHFVNVVDRESFWHLSNPGHPWWNVPPRQVDMCIVRLPYLCRAIPPEDHWDWQSRSIGIPTEISGAGKALGRVLAMQAGKIWGSWTKGCLEDPKQANRDSKSSLLITISGTCNGGFPDEDGDASFFLFML